LKPKRTHILSFSFLLAYSFFLFILAGCAAYHPVAVNEVPFKQHSQTQVDGNVRVTAAVLMNQENEQIFGFDLALRWVQAVWVEVENRDNHNYWLLSSALDPDYYSPNEIAYSGHRWLSLGVNDKIDARFKQLGFRNPIPPGSVVSGFFFVNLDQDDKEVDIDLISRVHKKFLTFYFQIPGLRAKGLHGNIQLGRHGGKRRLMAPGGPVFALTSYTSAGDSCRKTTRLRSCELRRGKQVMGHLRRLLN